MFTEPQIALAAKAAAVIVAWIITWEVMKQAGSCITAWWRRDRSR